MAFYCRADILGTNRRKIFFAKRNSFVREAAVRYLGIYIVQNSIVRTKDPFLSS
jgi:hypothetical protein